MVFPTPCPGTYGAPPLLVPAPMVLPWRFGLMSVANVIDETDDHARNGIRYKSPRCWADVRPWVDDCDSAEVEPKSPTDVPVGDDDPLDPYIQACPFHLYAALSCKTTTLAEMSNEVQGIFDLYQQGAIESQVWSNVVATDAVLLNADETEANAFTVVGGIAALESAMGSCYGGRATFHADRGVAAYAAKDWQIEQDGNTKYTTLGSAFAFYGGSPNTGPSGTPAPDGYAWIYATSDIVLRRFPVEVLPNEVNQRIQYDPLTNEPYVLAERTYVASKECCTFAALVCLSGDCN
jgi:hypothetical protein